MPSKLALLKILHGRLDIKFLTGLDFSAILSSPFSSYVLFDIACEQLEELKLLMLNRERR